MSADSARSPGLEPSSGGQARYPIDLDLRGKRALVVGLGTVGRRKVLGLWKAGAVVRGVDPLGWPEAFEGVEVIAEPYRSDHMNGAFLVVASAGAMVDREVVADASSRGLLVSSSSEPHHGNFTKPAVWQENGLIVTVSTSGASPALALALRDRAASAIGPSAAGLSAVFRELRPRLFERLADPRSRRRVLADWGDPRWLSLFESGGVQAVINEFERVLNQE